MSRGARSMPGGIGITFTRRMIGGRCNPTSFTNKGEGDGGVDGMTKMKEIGRQYE
jgi:hypothetical protein